MEREEMIEAIGRYLDDEKIHYQVNDEGQEIHFPVSINSKLSKLQIHIVASDDSFIVYAVSPLFADEESKPQIAELLHRANYGLRFGNFEMDHNDGEIRFKCTMFTDGLDEIPTEMIRCGVTVPLDMFSLFGNGIISVLMGYSTPEDEMKKIENASRVSRELDDLMEDDEEEK